jgi:hypothetical protein
MRNGSRASALRGAGRIRPTSSSTVSSTAGRCQTKSKLLCTAKAAVAATTPAQTAPEEEVARVLHSRRASATSRAPSNVRPTRPSSATHRQEANVVAGRRPGGQREHGRRRHQHPDLPLHGGVVGALAEQPSGDGRQQHQSSPSAGPSLQLPVSAGISFPGGEGHRVGLAPRGHHAASVPPSARIGRLRPGRIRHAPVMKSVMPHRTVTDATDFLRIRLEAGVGDRALNRHPLSRAFDIVTCDKQGG